MEIYTNPGELDSFLAQTNSNSGARNNSEFTKSKEEHEISSQIQPPKYYCPLRCSA